ncbi:hypothetical protein J8F10_10805 [Gemmata sp. G18]|uniref:Uncharacterized protein n=1 Tax=Gemmata palustris TaxID=2822762 RepID=A0ABS5BQ07_9BACT|nr:hypothetical protein [Gemmata palustris]MBP3955772.1 hypothetical protein [Gemmata palustris]
MTNEIPRKRSSGRSHEQITKEVGALEQVATELEHIPRWPGAYQGQLRAIYQMLRENDLGEKRAGGANQILHRCIAIIWRDVPGAPISYDRAFFDS